MEAQCGQLNSEGKSLSENPLIGVSQQLCNIYLQDVNQILTLSIKEKSLILSSGKRGQETFENMPEYSVLPNNACNSGETSQLEPLIRVWVRWEKEGTQLQSALELGTTLLMSNSIPTPAYLSFPIPSTGEEKTLRNTCEGSSPEL